MSPAAGRAAAAVWLTLLLGNAAALLRVAPLVAPGLFGSAVTLVLAASGVAGTLAVALFAWNLSGSSAGRPADAD